ncbi:hypothetical protein C5B42_01100 [Candidatus Cerribacteria bacterium 'Amazon FNV 2010 28 9']|uniref:Uncharacterized protein n=1 Tax=Candidatus Cerribacteria bacterium 'Amazon FNV 2010 28 9' TaxID=2081795 RepID=A0A317JR78_9BACT|nr:MAG: hypothetical protein C5B42_01100 [Candidatus Cerribacteria bacterium 'Amazon FNV 2010 28 9']
MKRFIRFINSLPFCGKVAIQPVVYHLYESTTRKERRLWFVGLVILLGNLVYFHSANAIAGLQVVMHAPPLWAGVICGIYALANICVVMAQIALGIRAFKFLLKGSYSRVKRQHKLTPLNEVIFMVVVTAGGQLLFQLASTSFQK